MRTETSNRVIEKAIDLLDNIMFGKEKNLETVKLVDFGLSAQYDKGQTAALTSKCGTTTFMAPEVFTNFQYSKYVDMWSIGINMFLLLTGRHPLYKKGEAKEEFIRRLKSPKWSFPASFSPLAQTLFLELVKVNPLERCSAKSALMHPWILREPVPIPLSYLESSKRERQQESLRNVKDDS